MGTASKCAAALGMAILFVAAASARLPPPSPEAQAKAADVAARTAWSDKVGAYQLCQATVRTAERYRRDLAAAGKQAPAPVDTPPCVDPGPYVAAAPAAPASAASSPLESSGAHSPAETAVGPPSQGATHAEQQGGVRK